ncbi:argininosuccinate lyase [Apilactobacillus timberlakei]|uniref:argininosuccinate lyase n=1 Tax=Apilactobacillus timberlakei TaxID=2008380 RepID=UPI00112EB5E4|nr:argininosuccinate lyase [Apilactobacillus timberlakei]TPR23208.1 argininosuccinate lyase [Apilactobacillus timberlakei]
MSEKLWGGRFSEFTNDLFDKFGASIYFDQEMVHEDIEGSIAHANMLSNTGILKENDVNKIIKGLKEIQESIDKGNISFTYKNEDIHMNIESILTEKIGAVAGKLHTARSRNDQVALDFHLYLKKRLPKIINFINDLQKELISLAEENVETIMPGYTHLQHAQPISYGHYLMAYYQMLQRDKERFQFNEKHTNLSPLGAAALAGTTFPIEPNFTANELGFDKPYDNSLDAVSDRDFALEFLSNSSIMMMHLSRFCEEICMWSSYEFNYIELSDDFSTGSSIMPQKKNPDICELIRGKTGNVYGHLMSLLSTMKSLPLAYNKDLQEDKAGVFDTIKNIVPILKLLKAMLSEITIKKDNMQKATEHDFSNATELADYLAKKGLPFRQAHNIVGKLVAKCIEKQCYLQDLSLDQLKEASDLIEEDIYHDLNAKVAVQRRNSYGGTGFDQVKAQIKNAKIQIKEG